MLKALIAAACIVVIAAGGLYGYGQFRESQERAAELVAARNRAVAALEEEISRLEAERLADCTRRVPSQSTENLKRLFGECMQRD